MTEEHKRKISESHMGSKNPMYGYKYTLVEKAEISNAVKKALANPEVKKKWAEAHKGHIVTAETRAKIGKANSIALKGNIPWNKGLSKYNEITAKNLQIRNSQAYKEWRWAVFVRDNFTCQICGNKKVSLRANHIKKFANYPDLRLVLANGITICKNCDYDLVMRHEEEWESYFNFNLKARGFLEDEFIPMNIERMVL